MPLTQIEVHPVAGIAKQKAEIRDHQDKLDAGGAEGKGGCNQEGT
jgi:hypothetical protein